MFVEGVRGSSLWADSINAAALRLQHIVAETSEGETAKILSLPPPGEF